MSNLWAITYDDIKAVTPSDTTPDPAGQFAGLLVTVGGTVKVTTSQGSAVTLVVVAGQYIHVPIKQVWSTGLTATVFGLTGQIKRPGSS